MSKQTSSSFKLSSIATLAALSLGMSSSMAFSEEAAEESYKFEKIIITASKRETGLQETPIAITVVSEEDIAQTKILDITDLQALVPALRVTPLQRSVNTGFALRGFSNGTNNTGIEPSVGVFIDGVYRSRASSQIGDLPRLDQIEVLSGPQSTLFGKNASAGVINVRTKAPSQDLEGKIEGTFGSFNQKVFKGYVTNGLTDNWSFSLSAGINTRDGYTDSIAGLSKLNDRDRWNIRGQLLFEPSEDVSLRLIADNSKIDEVCCTVASYITGPAAGAVQFLGGQVLSDEDPFSYESALNEDPVTKVDDSGFSLQADIEFDSFTFTSITALRNNDSKFSNDVDFTSLDFLQETAQVDIETFTQEFRFTSTGKNKLDWMVGAFIFQEDLKQTDAVSFRNSTRNYFDVLLAEAPFTLADVEGIYGIPTNTFFSGSDFASTDYTQENDAYSLFATFDYHISDKLTATVGISYTNDEKDITMNQVSNDSFSNVDFITDLTVYNVPLSFTPLGPAIPTLQSFQLLQPMPVLPNSVEDNSSSDSDTTWSVRLAYGLNDSVNLFATASTGFKATSWNLSRNSLPFPSDAAALVAADLARGDQRYGTRYAGPEESKVFEVGMKAKFDDSSLNITIFDQAIEGFQSSTFVGTGFVLTNAGEQSTKGIEFDYLWVPTENWTFTLAGILLDPIYDSFVGGLGPDGPTDLSGEKPDAVHERSITAGAKYNFEFDNGAYGYIRADYLYESETLLVSNLPADLTREVGTLNASAGMVFANDISLQIWARNLNNDEYFMSGFPAPVQPGSILVYPNQPRTVGVTVSYEF